MHDIETNARIVYFLTYYLHLRHRRLCSVHPHSVERTHVAASPPKVQLLKKQALLPFFKAIHPACHTAPLRVRHPASLCRVRCPRAAPPLTVGDPVSLGNNQLRNWRLYESNQTAARSRFDVARTSTKDNHF